MSRSPLWLAGASLLVVWTAWGTAAGAADFRAKKGEVVMLSGQSGRTVARFKGRERGDQFGASVGGDALPGGENAALWGTPGADGGVGRLWAARLEPGERQFFFSVDGADLAGGPVQRFGESILVLGHINGDTPSHWAVGAPGTGDPGGPPSAVVMLHAPGATLVERWRLEGAPESRLGWRIEPLDQVRTDSIVDAFAVSAPGQAKGRKKNAGAIYKISSVDGVVEWVVEGRTAGFHLGYAMRWASDWDGDGIRDLLVGAPHRKRGRVTMLSGATGQALWSLRAPAGARLFGLSVLEIDADADGTPDIVVGAPATDGAAGEQAGALFAFSGDDRSLLLRREGDAPGQWLGVALGRFLDTDGDGVEEFLASSFFDDLEQPRRGSRGGIDLIDPVTGASLLEIRGRQAGDRLGWPAVSRVLDADGDGVDDVLARSPRGAEIYLPE